ncbi:hypothetical protein BAE44_0003434 [Dichanthelium oligosanthes]|uniref:O-fucosyltransferase family protein n=1 Tax=Dichanthelium oligosanthes TaxID=888268 RepID=A0A1E5WDS6_9POAL|nr:hypothetical protein BAE44_0003434 [Dichanthelium oligosanthes]
MPEAAPPPLPLLAAVSSPAAAPLQRARRRHQQQQRRGWRRPRGLLVWGALVAFFFVMNWWMFSRLQDPAARPHFRLRRHPPRADAAASNTSSLSTLEEVAGAAKGKGPHRVMLTRLLALAAHALAEICNAVTISRLLNATLVIPKFLYRKYEVRSLTIYMYFPQKLRCRCNFHALRFVHKIQETGALLVERLHGHKSHLSPLKDNLLGQFVLKSAPNPNKSDASKYLAVHLRFEIDMVAYSLCYFGGGKDEEDELEAYRQIHFPVLTELKKTTKLPSAAFLRSEGKCPLAPEEAVLMLAASGFKRSTNIYIAGAEIYGGRHRMAAISRLYPALVTKETLLSPSELEPFRNFSSQLAALDFIACAAADAFAMTDPGSQFSSLVQGYRMYYGGGDLPTIRPNKRRLASILVKNATIEWQEFQTRVRKLIQQTKQVHERPVARSIFRHPRCLECMCRTEH